MAGPGSGWESGGRCTDALRAALKITSGSPCPLPQEILKEPIPVIKATRHVAGIREPWLAESYFGVQLPELLGLPRLPETTQGLLGLSWQQLNGTVSQGSQELGCLCGMTGPAGTSVEWNSASSQRRRWLIFLPELTALLQQDCLLYYINRKQNTLFCCV